MSAPICLEERAKKEVAGSVWRDLPDGSSILLAVSGNVYRVTETTCILCLVNYSPPRTM